MAPISDWPDGYAAWVPRLMMELRGVRESRQAHGGDRDA